MIRTTTIIIPKARPYDVIGGDDGGKRCFIHSPGSRLDRDGDWIPDSVAAIEARDDMILPFKVRGGGVILSPNGNVTATD
jgi:hypothetical protein